MADDKKPTEPTDPRAETAAGWNEESASAPNAMEPPPLDTTAEAEPEKPAARAEDRPKAAAAPVKDDDKEADGEAVSGRKAKKAERFREVDGARHAAERERDHLKAANAALETRLVALEQAIASKSGGAPPAKPAAAALDQTAKDEGLPPRPKLADFDNEAEYEAALDSWTHDTLSKREHTLRESLSTELREEVDQRLASERATGHWHAQFSAMKAAHPDFDEKVKAAGDTLKEIKNPFLQDVIMSTERGAEVLYRLVADPELAVVLAELPTPTKPMRDAIVLSSAPEQLLEYFATEEGHAEYQRIRTLHPVSALTAIGRLEASLTAAPESGSVVRTHPITQAVPPARPPAGSPRARSQGTSAESEPFDLETWIRDSNASEDAARRKPHLSV